MSPARRKLIIFLAVGGFVFSIGGIVFNTLLLFQVKEPSIDTPLFAPPALAIIGLGIACFVAGTIIGWKQQGVRESQVPPSHEPKSMVLRMPSNRNYAGSVTLKVRNGDNHDFDVPAEVMKVLEPGMIGTATILGRNLLSFEPDREQPNLKSNRTQQSVEESKANQP